MNKEEIDTILKELEFHDILSANEDICLLEYIKLLQQENKELIKEKIRLLVIIQKALKTNVINSEDMKFITKLHKELGSEIYEC